MIFDLIDRYILQPIDALALRHLTGCPHHSLSGDEGPVALLGRMPLRWRCDECGTIIHDHQEGCLCAKCRGDRWNNGEIV